MAVKKGGVPPKKPVIRAAVKPMDVASEADMIVRPRVSLPTAAEIRAEKEPAVIISRSKPTGWRAAKDKIMKTFHRNPEMSEHLAAVKAGVMHELETLGVKKGVAVSARPFGSPFSGILLPVSKPRRNWAMWASLAAVAIVFVGIIIWFGRGERQPGAVLVDALVAVREHDVKTFEAKVDVAGVATSVVNQMFNVPTQAGNPLAARMTAFVKPGLAQGLRDEILATVEGEPLHDDGSTLLAKVWQELGGENVRVGAPTVAMQDERMAVAELPLVRKDLGMTLPLQVVLNKGIDGEEGWQVSDIPNLAVVMDAVGQAEKQMEAQKRQNGVVVAAPEGIRVLNVKKLKDGKSGSNLVVNLDVANGGSVDAKDVAFDVSFGDAAGQPMMTTRLTLDGVLAAGNHREQVWTVPIDREKAAERYVADLPLSALTVTVTVVK